jgi:hypothetical protein
VGAQEPQQRENNQKANRTQPERHQKATSSCANIPLYIYAALYATVHILYFSDLRICSIRQSYSYSSIYHSKDHSQELKIHSKYKTTREQPEANQKATVTQHNATTEQPAAVGMADFVRKLLA